MCGVEAGSVHPRPHLVVWRERPLDDRAEQRHGFDWCAMTVGPGDTVATINLILVHPYGLARLGCVSIKLMPRPYAGPYARSGTSSVLRSFASPEPAGAANRQRSCVSGSRRATSSDRAEEAGSRSRSPGPAHKRGDGVMNGRHVPHASPAEKCDAARSRAMSERGAAPAAPLHPSEGKTTQTPWSLPRAPSSKARAGPVARLRPSAGLAWVGCRREAFLLVRAAADWRHRPLDNRAEDRRGFDCCAMTVEARRQGRGHRFGYNYATCVLAQIVAGVCD